MSVSLDNAQCAAEPIRIPGTIQPHGALLVLAADTRRIIQHSANAATILGTAGDPGALDDVAGLGAGFVQDLAGWAATEEPLFLRSMTLGTRLMQIVGHRSAQGLILEFEAALSGERQTLDELYPRMRGFVDTIEPLETVEAVAQAIAEEVHDLTGFDRTLIYRFEPDWNGLVVAEKSNGILPSYLDLRFPASDIPAQARELYRLNRLRLIPDVDAVPVPLVPSLCPADGQPLDMSQAGLRSVSPVHLEYMRNMGTASSMSVSIIVDGQLWGLISCHSRMARRVSPQIRVACDFLGRVVALQIAAKQRMADAAQRIVLKQVEAQLLAGIAAHDDFQTGLAAFPELWLKLASASGAAALVQGKLVTAGEVPPRDEIDRLAGWLEQSGISDFFETDQLSRHVAEARDYADIASGLAAVRVSQLHASYILWFRPETVRTVTWGGDPYAKPLDATGRLHPRQSFTRWKELVRDRAVPWTRAEIQCVREFRTAIVNFVLRQAEERADLAEELKRTNRELEAFSYSVSHDLRAPFRHIVGYAELLNERETALDDKSRHFLDSIIDAAMSAGRLVDDLLTFSQMGRTQLSRTRVDMTKLLGEVMRTIEYDVHGRDIVWRVGSLPIAWGDGAMLRQVLLNLVGNAVKYTRGRSPAIIEVRGEETENETSYVITDNGVGFDMAYVGKLFGVFQRLHRVEEFEGTGIGLALSRRIVDRHGGRIEALGRLGEGAEFRFTLPRKGKEKTVGRS